MALTTVIVVGGRSQLQLSAAVASTYQAANAALQTARPAQKSPFSHEAPTLDQNVVFNSIFPTGTLPWKGGLSHFQYFLAGCGSLPAPFCLNLNGYESPRAPPRMDPPCSC